MADILFQQQQIAAAILAQSQHSVAPTGFQPEMFYSAAPSVFDPNTLQMLAAQQRIGGLELIPPQSMSPSEQSELGDGETEQVPANTTGDPEQTVLTVRILMQSKEVGSIIGKKGEQIKRFREESNAKINVSDGSTSERIVSITGTTAAIHKAFTMVCKKFDEDLTPGGDSSKRPPVTLKLIVPSTQCGVIIGKSGCKIKEIRDATGASIQVASDMLPNSTERAVTIAGTAEAQSECIVHICHILRESSPKGYVVPYRPKPTVSPAMIAAAAANAALGSAFMTPPTPPTQQPNNAYLGGLAFAGSPATAYYGTPGLFDPSSMFTGGVSQTDISRLNQLPLVQSQLGLMGYPQVTSQAMSLASLMPPPQQGGQQSQGLLMAGNSLGQMPLQSPQYMSPTIGQSPKPQTPIAHANAAAAAPQQNTTEIAIPNDLIGCIIGRHGNKINEIRKQRIQYLFAMQHSEISGASIRIGETDGVANERKVWIGGTVDNIQRALYQINLSMQSWVREVDTVGENPAAGGNKTTQQLPPTPSFTLNIPPQQQASLANNAVYAQQQPIYAASNPFQPVYGYMPCDTSAQIFAMPAPTMHQPRAQINNNYIDTGASFVHGIAAPSPVLVLADGSKDKTRMATALRRTSPYAATTASQQPVSQVAQPPQSGTD